MKKFGTVVLVALSMFATSELCRAQCGCSSGNMSYSMGYPSMSYGSSHYRPPMPAYPPMTRGGKGMPPPRPVGGMPASIAYINRLATPVPRSSYTLNYAIHLTDGRILLSDFLPNGYTVRGIESQTGQGGRRLSASMVGSGAVTVRDPENDQTIATFGD